MLSDAAIGRVVIATDWTQVIPHDNLAMDVCEGSSEQKFSLMGRCGTRDWSLVRASVCTVK